MIGVTVLGVYLLLALVAARVIMTMDAKHDWNLVAGQAFMLGFFWLPILVGLGVRRWILSPVATWIDGGKRRRLLREIDNFRKGAR